MTPIRNYSDLQQFAGKAIAYQCYKDSGEFLLEGKNGVKFGTLSDTPEGLGGPEKYIRFDLYHFSDSIKVQQLQTELFNDKIVQLSLKMRPATSSEIDQLQKAVNSGKAVHYQDSYMSLEWLNLKKLAKIANEFMFLLGSKEDPNSSLKVFPPEIIAKILTSA